MPTDEIIVLANSLKMKGRCVAGISIRSEEWVRPVSEWDHGELYPRDFGMNGREPKPLDVVRFTYSRPVPEPAQPENVLLEAEPWELVHCLEPDRAYEDLESFVSSGPEIFGDRSAGISEERADAGMPASLTLVKPEDLNFEVRHDYKARALFDLNGQLYDLPVTDRKWKPRLRRQGPGAYNLVELGLPREVLLAISLGEPFNDTNWKLVAGCVPLG